MTLGIVSGGTTDAYGAFITIDRPTLVLDGDLLVAWIYRSSTIPTAPSAPDGWSSRFSAGGNQSAYLQYKLVTDASSEPSSYTWTWAVGATIIGGISRIFGQDQSNPFDIASDATYSDVDQFPWTPSITTQTDNAMVLWLIAGDSAATVSPPTDFSTNWSLSGTALAWDIKESAGATGVLSGGLSSSYSWRTLATAIRPAPTSVLAPICWGHSTGVQETARTFATNWTGTGSIGGSGDGEYVDLEAGETMESEIANTGAVEVTLLQNEYDTTGHDVVLYYRHASTEAGIASASWNLYSSPFTSLGYVQVRLALS